MQTLKTGARLGDYSIIRLIARGGMGEVYEAHDMRLDRRVALKVISRELEEQDTNRDLIRRFLQEARLLAKVNHPNVVTVHAIDSASNVQFIAMEYVEGASLREFLREGAFPVEMALYIFEQMLSGLKCLHENKIIHRDLKPGNVLVRADGQIKVLDFGIARRIDRGGHTDPGFIIGTPNYMAPELREGAVATPRSDFWSMGALFFECLTARPFAQAVKNRHGSPFNSEHTAIPVELRTMITCMTASDPEGRYAHVEQIIQDLRNVRRSAPAPSEQGVLAVAQRVQAIVEKSRPDSIPEPLIKPAATTVVVGRKAERSEHSKNPENEQRPAEKKSSEKKSAEKNQDVEVPGKSSQSSPTQERNEGRLFGFAVVAAIIAAVVLVLVLDNLTSNNTSPNKPTFHPPTAPQAQSSAPDAPLMLLEPSDGQWVWEEPAKNPTFVWSRGLNSGEYRIRIATDEGFRKLVLEEDVVNNWHMPTALLPEGKYFWRLVRQASNQPGAQSASSLASPLAETPARGFAFSRFEPVRLVRPENGVMLPGDFRAHQQNEFEWTCKPLVEQYRVQVSTEVEFSKPLREDVVKGCRWTLPPIPQGRYFWRVGVVDSGERRGLWSAPGAFSIAALIKKVAPEKTPERPIELAAPVLRNPELVRTLTDSGRSRKSGRSQGKAEAQIELAWYPVRGARNYTVSIARSKDFQETLWEQTTTREQVTWKASAPGQVYWRVTARGSGAVQSRVSKPGQVRLLLPPPVAAPLAGPATPSTAPSVVRVPATKGPSKVAAPVKNPLVAPTPLTPENAAVAPSRQGRISIEFSWASVPFAETYTLEVALDAEFEDVVKSVTIPVTKVLLERLELKGRVYWRIRANGSAQTPTQTPTQTSTQKSTQKSTWSKPVYLEIEPM